MPSLLFKGQLGQDGSLVWLVCYMSVDPLVFSNWFVQLGMAAGYNLLLWHWCEWANGVGGWFSRNAGRGVETLWSFFLSRTRASYKVCFCRGCVVVVCLGNVDW